MIKPGPRFAFFALGATIVTLCLALIAAPSPDVQAQGRGGDGVSAIEALVREGGKSSARKIVDLIQEQEDPFVAQRMGMALMDLDDPETIEELGDELEKLDEGADVFVALYIMTGLANGVEEETDTVLRNMVLETKDSEIYLKAAALEAMRLAVRTDLYDIVTTLLTPDKKGEFEDDWSDKYALVPISAAVALGYLWTEDNKFELMQCVVDLLEKTENERVHYFAAQAAANISGLKPYVNADYWKNWILQKGKVIGDMGDVEEGGTRSDYQPPKFFGTPAVGRRIVFVIDVSGSMASEVHLPPQDPPAEEEEDDDKNPITGDGREDGDDDDEDDEDEVEKKPDYSGVETKLDLAKVELIFTLENLDDDFLINVVTYDSEHHFLVQGWKSFQKSSDSTKRKFIDKIKDLTPGSATNMHGALKRAFSVTEGGTTREDPAWDPDGISEGVETIFFLTDGVPCWDDESTIQNQQTGLGNGPFCTAEPIIKDILRINTFRRAVIHTVGIGPHDRNLLETLSKNTGGNYRDLSGQ